MSIFKRKKIDTTNFPTIDEIYTRPGVMKDDQWRTVMTCECSDTKYIPKVKDAGSTYKIKNGTETQVMFNGLIVEKGGYYGDYMSSIIKKLKGHHEPQEEKAFYEVLKRIKKEGTMIELGSHWSYYSLWFQKFIGGKNYCFEPDPNYLEGGKRNAKLNDLNISFTQAAAGKSNTPDLEFSPESMPGKTVKVPIMSVDEIVKAKRIKKLDILHMDVQGHELEVLEGSLDSIHKKLIRFVFVSTHHHFISHDPLLHLKCLEFLKDNGANIITVHSVDESYSGDGLIVASFSKEDAGFTIDISKNYSGNGLFAETEADLAELAKNYQKLRKHLSI